MNSLGSMAAEPLNAEHVRFRAICPNLHEFLVLGGVVKIPDVLHGRELNDHSSVDARMAFEDLRFASADNVASAESGDDARDFHDIACESVGVAHGDGCNQVCGHDVALQMRA